MNRDRTIEVAQSLINGNRQDEYGKAEENFGRIAVRWQQLLGIEIKPWQVGVMMADLKLARLANGKPDVDSFVDGIGYLALASELSES
jgi:hypothetical protein